jgi:NTP pyrophosphatase (non-canonical NTP hydrolase)
VRPWRAKNFAGKNAPTLLGQMAGATGEAAEGMQAALKISDGRQDGEDNTQREEQIIDAIGDTLIYMMGACDLLGVTLEHCFEVAWHDVQNRTHENWEKNT